jgi:hypothetical protein
MALMADRVRETTTTAGTGTITLDGAATGYQSFGTAFGSGALVYYVIAGPVEWEIGIGTTGAGTLARTTVLQSTNGDALVPFSAGQKDVFCAYVADRAVTTSDAAALTNKTIDSYTNFVGANQLHLKCKAMANLAKGTVCKITGWNAGENAVEVNAMTSTADLAFGVMYTALTTGSFGEIINTGYLEGINTNAYAPGTILYPNGTGGFTSTKPTSGTYQACAYVLRQQSVNGTIYVEFTNPSQVEASTNTGNTLVLRDGSGNFAAGTATLTGLDVNGATTLRGNVSFLADATYDIGASASARPRNVYASSDAFFGSVRVGRGATFVGGNVVCGGSALAAVTTGGTNTACGEQTLQANTTGSSNTAVGFAALKANVTATLCTAVGVNALLSNASATGSATAVGYSALQALNGGGACTAVGVSALEAATSGNDNTAVGRSAGNTVSTGGLNTIMGRSTGTTITTGSRNTIIGRGANASAAAGNDQTIVGEGLTGKGDDTAFIGGVNGAYNEKNVTTWETVSDARLKRDIVDNHDGLDKINAIRVRNFTYRTPSEVLELPASAAIDKPGVQLGVIAQEMLPECVTETSEGVKSVSTDAVLYYLINAVQQLSATVETLKQELGR